NDRICRRLPSSTPVKVMGIPPPHQGDRPEQQDGVRAQTPVPEAVTDQSQPNQAYEAEHDLLSDPWPWCGRVCRPLSPPHPHPPPPPPATADQRTREPEGQRPAPQAVTRGPPPLAPKKLNPCVIRSRAPRPQMKKPPPPP